MKTYVLERITTLNTPIENAWNFFSDPANLARITPPDMQFRIISKKLPAKIHAGLIIQYKVKPLLGISVNWESEIEHEDEPYFFSDIQKKGPYASWQHEHSFEELGDGTLMRDTVIYAMPYGVLGRIVHFLLVRKRLEHIFDYRIKAVKQLFPD